VPQSPTISGGVISPRGAGSSGYCVANTSDVTGQTVDCYVPYTSTTTLSWNIVGNTAPQDLDDPNGSDPGGNGLICGPMTVSSSEDKPGTVAATVGAIALSSCPNAVPSTQIATTIAVNADPASGPSTTVVSFKAAVTAWDPSDNDGDSAEADFSMIVHIGACSSGTTPSSSARKLSSIPGRVVHSAAKRGSSAKRRPHVGGIGNTTMVYGLPVLTGSQSCSVPAPTIAKSLYTASLASKPELDFTDTADASTGTLTWHVGGDTGNLKNVQLSAATTAAPPHSNALSFEVPADTPPRDYLIHVSVTASASGQSSPDTVVTLRVLPPVSAAAEVNPVIYEEDAQGNVIVPDGANPSTDDDGQVPDFPIIPDTSEGLSSNRHPQAVADVGFNPLAPPAAVDAELKQREASQRFGCNGYVAESNEAGDMTSGTSRGVVRVVVYCQNFARFAGVFLGQVSANLNRPQQIQSSLPSGYGCDPIGLYRTFHVCATPPQPVSTVLGHAELTQYYMVMRYVSGIFFNNLKAGQNISRRFYINDNGVFYPKVRIQPSWAIPSVYAEGGGYVKFPAGPFYYCSKTNTSKSCHRSDRAKLAAAMRLALPAPPAGFQAHHIKEVSWCGDNSLQNGVYLPQNIADDEQEWEPNTHGQFTTWWLSSNFTPDNPRPECT